MGIDNTLGINETRRDVAATLNQLLAMLSAFARQLGRIWCGINGHLVLLHFEPNKLSLQCSFCGYETEGWEVGRPMTARRQANNPQGRPDRRRTLRPLPTNARLAS